MEKLFKKNKNIAVLDKNNEYGYIGKFITTENGFLLLKKASSVKPEHLTNRTDIKKFAVSFNFIGKLALNVSTIGRIFIYPYDLPESKREIHKLC